MSIGRAKGGFETRRYIVFPDPDQGTYREMRASRFPVFTGKMTGFAGELRVDGRLALGGVRCSQRRPDPYDGGWSSSWSGIAVDASPLMPATEVITEQIGRQYFVMAFLVVLGALQIAGLGCPGFAA